MIKFDHFIELLKIIVLIISAISPILLAYIAYKQARLHKTINGRMDELIEAKRAEGNIEGRKEQNREMIDTVKHTVKEVNKSNKSL